ncbi:MAG: hypothetical protein RMI94_15765, partial [Bryobacterales bacterium]|nr:hypothetical protein [Bryobacteraceae bacterium]MDW8132006.1 hypothetical protein [Bryobacterales bacterium]
RGARRAAIRVEKALEALSEAYGLASRRMALVAVVERAGDQPGVLAETHVVPLGMPSDVSFRAYFPSQTIGPPLKMMALSPREGGLAFCLSLGSEFVDPQARPIRTLRSSSDEAALERLFEISVRLEADGGMPGADMEERALASILALLAFLQAGSGEWTGLFQAHVRRLVEFLENVTLPVSRKVIIEAVLGRVRQKRPLPGDWIRQAIRGELRSELWDELARALEAAG